MSEDAGGRPRPSRVTPGIMLGVGVALLAVTLRSGGFGPAALPSDGVVNALVLFPPGGLVAVAWFAGVGLVIGAVVTRAVSAISRLECTCREPNGVAPRLPVTGRESSWWLAPHAMLMAGVVLVLGPIPLAFSAGMRAWGRSGIADPTDDAWYFGLVTAWLLGVGLLVAAAVTRSLYAAIRRAR